jgi:hypothetical protein
VGGVLPARLVRDGCGFARCILLIFVHILVRILVNPSAAGATVAAGFAAVS